MAALPMTVGIESMTMRLVSATAITQSPFTFDQQVFAHPGVRWEAEVTLPPMTRSEAREYEGFFASLRGMKETFTMYNPLNTTNAQATITGDVGDTSVTGFFSGTYEVGDYFSLDDYLYIITDKPSSIQVDIMPPLKTEASSDTVDFTLPNGTWRLSSNEIGWSIDRASLYGFSFSCIEAI
jgi:hypothetical protein